jgi:hypothetical protein
MTPTTRAVTIEAAGSVSAALPDQPEDRAAGPSSNGL